MRSAVPLPSAQPFHSPSIHSAPLQPRSYGLFFYSSLLFDTFVFIPSVRMLTMVRYKEISRPLFPPDLSAPVHVGYLYKHVALNTDLGNRIIDIGTEPLPSIFPPVIPF